MATRVHVLLVAALILGSGSAHAQFRPAGPPPVPGEDFHLEIGAVLWTPAPELVLSTDARAAIGSAGVDFVREFGITKTRFTEFRGVLKGGKHRLRVAKTPIAYASSAILERPIAFAGRLLPAGTNATIDLTWDLWRVGYQYDFVSRPRGSLGLVTEVKYNRIVADLRGTSGTVSASTLTDVKVPLPTLGFVLRVYPVRSVGLTADVTGIKMPGYIRNRLPDDLDVDGRFVDFDISATVSISRFLGIQGGYRSVATNYLVNDDSGDLTLKGGYIGGMVRF